MSFFLFVVILSIFAKEITDWPGYSGSKLPFKSYGDYVDIEGTKRSYYYMLHESYDKDSDNVIMWTNGGPGCSSLEGFATENGIFRLQYDGETLLLNEYSWNKLGHTIYIDTPAGVGFSTNGEKTIWDDDLYADDVYHVLLGIFEEFPELQKKNLWLTGESYAGFYIPALVNRIHAGNMENEKSGKIVLPLKGFNIGNGCMDRKEDVNSIPDFLLQHSIITQPMYDLVMTKCKNDPWTYMNETSCSEAYDEVENVLFSAEINPYFFYDECPIQPMKNINNHFFINGLASYKKGNDDTPDSCTGLDQVKNYFNNEKMKKAIHANVSVEYEVCNFDINENWNWKYQSQVPFYKKMLKYYRGQFFSGDSDGIVNGVGSMRGFEKVGMKVTNEWRHWKVAERSAGFVVNYENFAYVTVRGAGHMVPQVKPVRAFALMQKFLEDDCC